MVSPTPSIGDILMLSQLAWKIGCAFTSGRQSAPAQFQEIENELKSLTTAITSLAEAVDTDENVLSKSDVKTREGLDRIVSCCRQSLMDLEAFVDQYQELHRPSDTGQLITQRAWKKMFLRNYKVLKWTTEGGTIETLQSMLAMHCQSISLTVQALHTRSLSRLERTIEPMGERVEYIQNKLDGDLDVKIDEMHHLMLSLQASFDASPRIPPLFGDTLSPASAYNNTMSSSPPRGFRDHSRSPGPYPSYASSSYSRSPNEIPELPELSDSESSAYNSPTSPRNSKKAAHESSVLPPGHDYLALGSHSRSPPPVYRSKRQSINTNDSSQNSPDLSRRPESQSPTSAQTFATLQGPIVQPPAIPQRSIFRAQPPIPSGPEMLPAPALEPDAQTSSFNTTFYDEVLSIKSMSTQETRETRIWNPPSSTTATQAQHDLFRSTLLRNAAILCEIRGVSIDYTEPDPEKHGEWKMAQACAGCTVMLVRKKQKLSTGAIRFATSVWTLSDDLRVRLEQTLADGEEVIPYTLWGVPEKVVLRVPTKLIFHGTATDALPIKMAQTSWVNYLFEPPDPEQIPKRFMLQHSSAALFQNALIGRTLLLSVRTRRTMRVFEGVKGMLTYAEQLCGLEQLRIFQDPSTGGCLALMHYSPSFRDGYMCFYLNSTRDRITAKDEGDATVKIKGLNIPLEEAGRGRSPDRRASVGSRNSVMKRGPMDQAQERKNGKEGRGERFIGAAKIEFYTAEERRAFRETLRELQGTFFPGER